MTVMLERWSDERMDDLAAKVDGVGAQLREQRRELREEMRAGFARMDRELRDHRQEMLELRKDMKAGFERVDKRFERVDKRFAKLERRITNAAIGLVGAIIVGFAALANGPL